MKTRFLCMVILGVFVLSFSTMAQNPERRRKAPQQRGMMADRADRPKRNMEQLFTEEQREQLKALRLSSTSEIQPLSNELNELEAKQRTLTTSEDADMNAINKNIEKMADVRAEIQKIRAKEHQEIRSMLSDEQRIKFDQRGDRRNARGDFGRRPDSLNRFKHGA
ncbi:MAG TPA: Spy/CpxP family protein refolding chaperone [Draconibacterium sp.]|nr:Spy/CpxP family protein refolding chaperone [Draconibacterium sp.]